ncbi:MAG: endo-1,4-beta-xylanase [Acidobacteria bacterium]|nr:endo-1,4-beta-xylanase [Acidobacteriota bacterium]
MRLLLAAIVASNLMAAQSFDGVDEASKPVMERARQRIEQIRKGDFQIRVVDAAGKPIASDIAIRLVRHEFRFGASTLGIPRLEPPLRDKALGVVDELFNTVSIVNYWSVYKKTPGGEPDWADADRMLAWALDHGKTMRFHAMLYGPPRWISQVHSTDEWWRLIEARIKEVAERYGRHINEYDVLNEIAMQVWYKSENWQAFQKSPSFPYFEDPANGARCFALARKYLPNAELVNNDATIATAASQVLPKILNYAKDLLAKGAPIDVIGHQAHFYASGQMPFQEGHKLFGKGAFTMKALEEGLDQLGSLGKPVHITEFSPPSRSTRVSGPQPSLTGEEIAAWQVNYYTLAFSKPYIGEITRWFVIDELGGRGVDAGLITKDGQLKPAYYALKQLLKTTWSSEWHGKASRGTASFHGFYGQYEVTAPGFEKAVFTAASGGPRSVTVQLRRSAR